MTPLFPMPYATPLEYLRLALVVGALCVNVIALLDAYRDLKYVFSLRGSNEAVLIARRNVRREHLRCFKQTILLGVAAISLFATSQPWQISAVSTLAMILISFAIAGEALWERNDRRLLIALRDAPPSPPDRS